LSYRGDYAALSQYRLLICFSTTGRSQIFI